jgi:DNA-binding FadR family transcriptional regulator
MISGKGALADERLSEVNAAPMDADYTPRYIRLARLLRVWIEDGTYPLGSLLPSTSRLAEVHTVSKATARHALQVLERSGHARHIESKPHQVIWRQAGHAEKSA